MRHEPSQIIYRARNATLLHNSDIRIPHISKRESDMIHSDILPEEVVSGPGSVEPVAGPSSSSLEMDEDNLNEAGGSLSTSLLKRKRSGSDIMTQEGSYATTGVFLFLLPNFDIINPIFR